MTTAPNIHATAIIVGRTGLLFSGPSGWGKSMLAFTCMTEARRLGLFTALVADDQVLLSEEAGTVIAACPPSIAGLIELRGTGIVRQDHIPRAPMHYAVLPGSATGEERVPPEGEIVSLAAGLSLPALRLLTGVSSPLAILMAKAPDIGH
ncbi:MULTISPECIES: serine/threonine protein kinase [unclassified Rhizobium]|uniref:HPr kinase/phosphorylase n=1 Tax=unclassified Rhizobium TaxID=2613769 RepID=UPI001A9937FB|nr:MULTISPECIES: serine/threonine protein kinase [unclassified Rhizobium]MBX5158090.1 serine/threonine protein kinase [Rhizobium sp. NZLR8]MBX5163400.1 serine/threonine protein kinase [Rhizobium sp. NZLR4b]MBX5169169.1 serine/threonine protein kinase [Rhizobium sp. NZLR1b]MBX5182738.1 serine/threonine protein kinase [Rhizobium sp. NZLR5]MBX5189697.1 serine/threonine protein kinase [Rhizobium sp. NZLR3b]